MQSGNTATWVSTSSLVAGASFTGGTIPNSVNITNNTQASSILKLNHDEGFYRDINITSSVVCRAEKLSSFLKRIEKDSAEYNFWNLDIQGAEFKALVGGEKCLAFAKVLYLEVNEDELYKGCTLKPMLDYYLESQGFKCVAQMMCGNTGWGDAIYVRV
jgi:hypothetical protein